MAHEITRTPPVWVSPQDEGVAVKAFAQATGHPDWLASLFLRRGIADDAALEAWLNPRLGRLRDPLLLPGMEAGVGRMLDAILRCEHITIFGDYDVDGITSAALMATVLKAAGASFSVFLPHRLEEGYGLSREALVRCLEETNPGLIMTVDCGTGSVESVRDAAASGVDVIVTDHHTVGESVAPAVAVINPRISGDTTQHVLAGVGVAFKFAHALLKVARRLPAPPAWAMMDPRELLDLVALGTIADLVPLTDENRILVQHGLTVLNQKPRTGLQALIRVSAITREVGTYEVGFQLGPRLNAAGRLGTAHDALKLLLTGNSDEAKALASELDTANRERQAVERETVLAMQAKADQRMEQGDVFALVEADPHWHPGVVGIVASKIAQHYIRPVIVIGQDDAGRAKGSGRCGVPGFNLVQALDACSDLLVKHGGHAAAAGLEILWEKIDAFRDRFEQVAAQQLAGLTLCPQIRLDGWLTLDAITEPVVAVLERMGPYGMGNPEPVWGCRNLYWADPPRQVGKGHLKGRLKCGHAVMDAIGFGLYQPGIAEGPWDAAFQIRREEYMGREKIVLHLKDLRVTEN